MKKVKIKLWKKRYFVEVRLFPTKKDIQKATKDKKAAGLYHPQPYSVYPRLKIPLKLGTIYLCQERLGVGYISHEVLHCVMDYAHKVITGNTGSFDFENNDDEEEMCLQHGYIVKEICNWLYKIKIWV